MTTQDIVYGTGQDGRMWRAHAKPDQPALTVLEVVDPDMSPKDPQWDLWGICNDEEMNDISDRNDITWLKSVIEV